MAIEPIPVNERHIGQRVHLMPYHVTYILKAVSIDRTRAFIALAKDRSYIQTVPIADLTLPQNESESEVTNGR